MPLNNTVKTLVLSKNGIIILVHLKSLLFCSALFNKHGDQPLVHQLCRPPLPYNRPTFILVRGKEVSTDFVSSFQLIVLSNYSIRKLHNSYLKLADGGYNIAWKCIILSLACIQCLMSAITLKWSIHFNLELVHCNNLY